MNLGIAQVPEGRRLFGALSVEDNLLLGAYTRDDNEIERDLESIYERFPILKERRKKHSNRSQWRGTADVGCGKSFDEPSKVTAT